MSIILRLEKRSRKYGYFYARDLVSCQEAFNVWDVEVDWCEIGTHKSGWPQWKKIKTDHSQKRQNTDSSQLFLEELGISESQFTVSPFFTRCM